MEKMIGIVGAGLWTLDNLIQLKPSAGATPFDGLMVYGSATLIRLAPKLTDVYGEPLSLLDNALRKEDIRTSQKSIDA